MENDACVGRIGSRPGQVGQSLEQRQPNEFRFVNQLPTLVLPQLRSEFPLLTNCTSVGCGDWQMGNGWFDQELKRGMFALIGNEA